MEINQEDAVIEDKEEIQEEIINLAAAKVISMDVIVLGSIESLLGQILCKL